MRSKQNTSTHLTCAGIRHRRNRLGTSCVSIFEDLASPSSPYTRDPVHQQANKQQQAQQHRWPPHGRRSSTPCAGARPQPSPLSPHPGSISLQGCSSPLLHDHQLAQLHKRILRMLPHVTGHAGPLFQRAARLMERAALSSAADWWAQELPRLQRSVLLAQQQQQQQQQSLPPLLTGHSVCRDGSSNPSFAHGRASKGACAGHKVPLLRLAPPQLAVLSVLCCMLPWLQDVRMAVNLLPGTGPEAAATTVSVELLLAALQKHTNLQSVEVRL